MKRASNKPLHHPFLLLLKAHKEGLAIRTTDKFSLRESKVNRSLVCRESSYSSILKPVKEFTDRMLHACINQATSRLEQRAEWSFQVKSSQVRTIAKKSFGREKTSFPLYSCLVVFVFHPSFISSIGVSHACCCSSVKSTINSMRNKKPSVIIDNTQTPFAFHKTPFLAQYKPPLIIANCCCRCRCTNSFSLPCKHPPFLQMRKKNTKFVMRNPSSEATTTARTRRWTVHLFMQLSSQVLISSDLSGSSISSDLRSSSSISLVPVALECVVGNFVFVIV
jgi:hypothetical protein